MAEKDPQLETRKRARRRLVGAAALALVAAVVLPMVMDAEPKPITEDIQIRIPNPDATASLSRPLPVKAPGKPAETRPPASAEAVPIESDGGSVKPAADLPKAKKPDAPKPAPPEAQAKPVPKPETTAEARPQAAKPAAAKTAEQFILQLGTFSDADNARRVRTKAKGLGVEAYSETIKAADGSEKLRVRAGPFPSRAAADAARGKLVEAGLDAVVTVKQ